jgi:hypothetical protein
VEVGVVGGRTHHLPAYDLKEPCRACFLAVMWAGAQPLPLIQAAGSLAAIVQVQPYPVS